MVPILTEITGIIGPHIFEIADWAMRICKIETVPERSLRKLFINYMYAKLKDIAKMRNSNLEY